MTTSEKTCFKCHCKKPLFDFYKHKKMADGHLNKCKDCAKRDSKDHRNSNLKKYIAYDKQRAMLPHRVEARNKYAKTEVGKKSVTQSRIKYLANNPDRRKQTTKSYYARNKEDCRERIKNYHQKNIERMRAVKLAFQRKRELTRKRRTPAWLTAAEIESMKVKYLEARWMTRRTGFLHHVDHIVPLQGENVSGLHVPWNLRVIPARENIVKRNSF